MRGCLISLAILLIVGFLLLWVALPAFAGVLALNAMRASGMTGTDMGVTVAADPPFRLLLGQADSVHLTGEDVSIHDLSAGHVDVILEGVSIFDQSVDTVHGTFASAALATPGGDPVNVDEVTIDGAADNASATLLLSAGAVRQLAEARLLAETGLSATVTLVPPDGARIAFGGRTVSGRLVVASGALVLKPDTAALPSVTLIDPRQGNPFQLRSIVVTPAGGAQLTGTLDIAALLQGRSAVP